MTNEHTFQAGFVSILGKPNAGKSTLLNALLNEKLAIVSHKIQTTRHRILGIVSEDNYQIIFSDTPGIITPEYTMHQRMMTQVTNSLKDADAVLFMVDVHDDITAASTLLSTLKINVPIIVLMNKIDVYKKKTERNFAQYFTENKNVKEVIEISALLKTNVDTALEKVISYLPIHPPYYDAEEISDRPMRFFVSEIIRGQLYDLLKEELPYHSTVLVEAYEEKNTLTKITASIIVTRETQKGIVLGVKGSMIQKIGTLARIEIEKFIGQKVFLDLHVKVRANWRNMDNFLNEYGY